MDTSQSSGSLVGRWGKTEGPSHTSNPPQYGEWEIIYKIDDSPRSLRTRGRLDDIYRLIARLEDSALYAGRILTVDHIKFIRKV